MSLQHLLVDEMQDTSSAQYELIQLLTQRWDGHSQTVFLVGDPKQSIYLFRQARVERFVRTLHLQRLGDVPLGTLALTANFRSQATLVQAFNQDFAQIFPTSPDPLQPGLVPFRQAHPMRPPTAAASRVWHAQALPYADRTEDRSTLKIADSRTHASLIASVAARWRLHPRATQAVLVRNRTHLLDIVKAFRAANIPYRAVEIEPLAERQEILDLVSLTRALLHPADRTAWLALLRSPWCGLALADLHILAGQDDPSLAKTNLTTLIEQRGDLLSPDALARLEPFWSVMQAALAQRGTMPLTTLVERTWQAFAAPLVLPPEALTNAGHYFQLLHQLEQEPGPLHLQTLAQQLSDLYAAPATHPGAVDLMTIHKSKGLEWDVVFVPALERTGRVDTGSLISWLEIDAGEAEDSAAANEIAHGILAPIQAKGRASHQLTTWMRSIESAREAAERKRLFYVACTRAREELHLFAAPALNAKGELKPAADSLLQAAWPAAQPHIAPPRPSTDALPAVLDRLAAAAPDLAAPEDNILPVSSALPTLGTSGAPGLDFETWDPTSDHPSQPGTAPKPTLVPRLIQRIPRNLLPAGPATQTLAPPPRTFPRPEGSFPARTFGNAMHAFLDQLTTQLTTQSPEAVLAALPTWSARIAAVLRSSGLAAQHVQRYAATLQRGLANTLQDPEGLWLLTPHPGASSETSLTTAEGTLRLDRTFLAGPTPGSQGQTHLWIVDYKTSTHAQTNLADFLAAEKFKYQPQLETYATALAPRGLPLRCALYHPPPSRSRVVGAYPVRKTHCPIFSSTYPCTRSRPNLNPLKTLGPKYRGEES